MNTSTENTIELKGLREDNPRDFLAALGVLNLAGATWSENSFQLTWNKQGSPVLCGSHAIPDTWGNDIWNAIKSFRNFQSDPLGLGKIEAISPEDFRSIIHSVQYSNNLETAYFSALASQIQWPKAGRRSHLIIESANRSVIKGADDLVSDPKFQPDLKGDLLGSTSLETVSNTPRWHPSEAQPAAYAAHDPKTNKHRDRLSLNVLALFGLSFYPVVDLNKSRSTLGLSRVGRESVFTWPIWNDPLNRDEMKSLIHSTMLHGNERIPDEVRHLGISHVWRSRKYQTDQNDYFSQSYCLLYYS